MNMFRAFMELDRLHESVPNPQEKHGYQCDDCGFYSEFFDDEITDGCCPNCHNHHGNFNKCEDPPADPLMDERLAQLRDKPKYAWTEDDYDLYVSVADDPAIHRPLYSPQGPIDEAAQNWVARSTTQQTAQPSRKYMANAKYVLAIEPPADQDDPVFWYFDSDCDEYDRDDLETAMDIDPHCVSSSFDEIVRDANALVGSYSEDEVYIVVFDAATLNIIECIELADCQEYQDYRKEYNKRFGLSEGVFDDIAAPNEHNWVSRSPAQQKQQPAQTSAPAATKTTTAPNKIVTIFYDYTAHKLRARADDGIHGPANVSFPTKLRNKVGQQYAVDDLVWNGKNYRAVGTIVPI